MKDKKTKTSLFINAATWRDLKVRAAQEGISVTEALHRAIAVYLKQKPLKPQD